MAIALVRLMCAGLAAAACILAGCVATSAAPPAKITFAGDRGDVEMVWGASARPAPLPPLRHAALLVPVVIDGVGGRPLHMQFDLGHPSTIVYSNKWADIAKRIPSDSGSDKIGELRFMLGSLHMSARDIAIVKREGAGIDWAGTAVEIIGTIGADLIDGRVVVLDFKAERITLARSRETLARPTTKFQPFTFQGRRILLPANFEGKSIQIMYDSGSSAFAWLTNESTFARLAQKGAAVETYPIRSWDKMLSAHTVATDAAVTVGDIRIPIGEISRIEGMGMLQEAAIGALGIGGMTGNKLFLGYRLIIDTGKLEFAIEA